MKKLIYAFEIMIAIIVFTLSFSTISRDQFERTDNFIFLLSNEHQEFVNVSMTLDTNPSTRKANFNEFMNLLEKENCIAVIPIQKQGDNMLQTWIRYVYAPKGYLIPNIYLRNDKQINFSRNTDKYYTSYISDKQGYDTIDFIDRNYNKDYQNLIQIKQLSKFLENNDSLEEVPLYIISDHASSTLDTFLESDIGYLFNEFEEFEDVEYTIEPQDNSLSYKFILFSAMALFILICCDVLKSKKEIMTRKMFGANCFFIFRKMFLKTFVLSILLYPSTQIICYMMRIGNLRTVQFLLINQLAKYFLLYTLFTILAGVAIYIIILCTHDYKHMKKQGNSNRIPYFSLLLNMTFMIMIVSPMLSIYAEASSSLQTLWVFLSHKDAFIDSNYIAGIGNHHKDMDASNAIALMESYVLDHGGIYQDFHKNKEAEELKKAFPYGNIPLYDAPYIVVNKAYLQRYDVKLMHGTTLDLDTLHGNVLLIPEKYKDISTDLYCEDHCSQMIEVANHQTYYNLNAYEYDYDDLVKKDPIILVTEDISNKSWNNFYFDMRSEKERNKLQTYMEKNKLENIVYLGSTNELYQNSRNRNIDLAIHLVCMTAIYFILLFIFVFQSIYIDFYEHKGEFAMNYLVGKNHWQRHKQLYLKTVFVYAITFIILSIYQKIPLRSLMKLESIMIVFEFLLTYLMIRRMEHNNIIAILKGED